MEAQQNQAMYARPTWRQKLWRVLGYRYHLGAEPEGTENMKGWMCTDTHMRFGITDRLRLLLTGKLNLRLVQHTEVQCEGTKNRLDWQIVPPGERA